MAYVINIDKFKSLGTQWIALYVNGNNILHFENFPVEHVYIGNIMTNIYRLQASDWIIFGYFCNGYIDFMLKGKIVLVYTNLFSPNDYEKNDRIILKHFQ